MMDGWVNDIHCGDAAETLAGMPENSVHMAMCSPPYYGLRDYGDGTITVWDADEDCDHEWVSNEVYQDSPVRRGGPDQHDTTDKEDRWRTTGRCTDCGARREQLGLEEQLGDYIQDLVEVGREIRRVLRPDGSWWLNLGDSYAGSWGAQSKDETSNNLPQHDFPDKSPSRQSRLGRKNKMLVPHRVAIALQDDGWVVRNDATWVKPNPMPSSVKDRLNTTTEQVFHLTPEPDYWYDLDAIREPHAESTRDRFGKGYSNADDGSWVGEDNPGNHDDGGFNDPEKSFDDLHHPAGKNPGDVFEVNVRPFPEAHFAVYPPELCKTPIKASCPPKVCAECGSPYERVVDRTPGEYDYSERGENVGNRTQASESMLEAPEAETVGWDPTCDCDTDETNPGIVLDPFAGAGTTCLVAKRLGRRFIGIDLNPEYVAMAQKRVGVDVDDPEHIREDAELGLEAYADGGAE